MKITREIYTKEYNELTHNEKTFLFSFREKELLCLKDKLSSPFDLFVGDLVKGVYYKLNEISISSKFTGLRFEFKPCTLTLEELATHLELS